MITENNFGTGGIIEPKNNLIANFNQLVADVPVFDWVKGFDIREKLGKDISLKNQNGSGSCGGMASSYLTEAIVNVGEFSARSIYNKCYVQGGGSSLTGLITTILNTGVDLESVTTSYENGLPPSEEFMHTPDSNPYQIKGATPMYINVSFDEIANALLQNKGVVIGISGQNNGTWLSVTPMAPNLPPRSVGLWNHWLYIGFAGMRDGKRVLGVKNSWGNVGDNGWQYLDESHLPYIWCAWSMMYQTDSKPSYQFNNIMTYGTSSKDIVKLQDVLRYEGLFNNPSTGFYGNLTAGAVLAFQRKYKIASTAELNSLGGKRVGSKTLTILKKLYGQ